MPFFGRILWIVSVVALVRCSTEPTSDAKKSDAAALGSADGASTGAGGTTAGTGNGVCLYTCDSTGWQPGLCRGGWLCDCYGACLSYTGCSASQTCSQ